MKVLHFHQVLSHTQKKIEGLSFLGSPSRVSSLSQYIKGPTSSPLGNANVHFLKLFMFADWPPLAAHTHLLHIFGALPRTDRKLVDNQLFHLALKVTIIMHKFCQILLYNIDRLTRDILNCNANKNV